jgi:hypothetical protein
VSFSVDLPVPQLSYNSSTWATIGPFSSSDQFWSASADVQRAGFAAATGDAPVGALHAYDNETYHLDFYSPAIQCSTANNTVLDGVEKTAKGHTGSGGHYAYSSWVGDDDHGFLTENLTLGSTWKSLDVDSTDASRIFVFSALGGVFSYRNVSECLLYNASYSVDFSIQNGNSIATLQQLTLHEKLTSLDRLRSHDLFNYQYSLQYSYQAVMDVFGKLLVGYGYAQNSGTQVYYSSFQRTYVNWNELEKTQRDLETLFQNITLSMFSRSSLL